MTSCRVLELRQYTLRSGRRDVLIDLFDREFVESQERLGMCILGQFRNLDEPDRFVWLRGFADMESRRAALTAFYGGPVWAAHKHAANATMVDVNDVLLLRPVQPDAALPAAHRARPPLSSTERPKSLIAATVYASDEPITQVVLDFFTGQVEPFLTETGGRPLLTLQTEPAENTFPALPVRTAEHVLVRLARFDDLTAHTAHLERLRRSSRWNELKHELGNLRIGQAQQLRLQPTARSLLS